MQITISPSDYISAVRLGLKPRPIFAVLLGLLAALALVGLALAARSAVLGRASWVDLLCFLAICYFPYWYWLYLPWRVRRLYQQQRSIQEPFSVEFEDQGLRFRNSNGEGLLPWRHLHRWRESKSAFVLYESDALIHILPKRHFESPMSAARFREMLEREAGPANKVLKPTAPPPLRSGGPAAWLRRWRARKAT